MAIGVFARQEIHFGAEASYCEDVDTFDFNIPVLDVQFEPVSGRATDRSKQSRLWETRPGYNMPRSGGLFRIRVYATGADTEGGYVADWLQTLLASGFGGSGLTGVGGVAGATATTVAMPNATGTHPVGHIIRVGESRDARANGQATVIGASASDLLVALPGAPGATDVIRACQMIYPTQALGATQRFALKFTDTPNRIYVARGCALENPELVFPFGDLPYWELPFRYGYWEVIDTIADLALEDCDTATCDGGSVFVNYVETTSANTSYAQASSVAINFNMALAAIPTLGGAMGRYQTIGGWARLRANPDEPAATMRMVSPELETPMTVYDSDGSDSNEHHALITLNAGGAGAANKRRFNALYAPRMFMVGQRPAFVDFNGLKYQEVSWGLREGPDTTNDLTKSFIRIGRS